MGNTSFGPIVISNAVNLPEPHEMPEGARFWAMSVALKGPTPAGGRAAIWRGRHDVVALAALGSGHERLDQLVTELLLGAR